MSLLYTLSRKKKLDLNSVICLQGQVNYTKIFFLNKKPLLVAKTLKLFEKSLQEIEINNFYRPSKTYIINLKHVKKIEHIDSVIQVELTNDIKFSISRRKKKGFISLRSNYLKNN